MIRVLVIEDEERILNIIREYLEFEGYEVDEAKNGQLGIERFYERDYDCIILDIMMPKISGLDVLREIRNSSQVPVIMLTAKGEEYDRLRGFELGADDYVLKPFSPRELMARIKVILRRNKKFLDSIYIHKGLKIDLSGRQVSVDGEFIKLTPKEFDLLVYMFKNENIALSRQQILDGVWGFDFLGEDRTVDTHIKLLRDSLGPYKDIIKTIWGTGYKLELGDR